MRRQQFNGVGGIVDGGSIYQRALDYFNALKAPAIFTTGDNDWTAIARVWVQRPENSLRMLDYERSLFFSTPLRWFCAEMQKPSSRSCGIDGFGILPQSDFKEIGENWPALRGNDPYATVHKRVTRFA